MLFASGEVAGLSLTSSVILDFLFRVRDTSLCLTLFLFWLSLGLLCEHNHRQTLNIPYLLAHMLFTSDSSHLSLHLQFLQLSLVSPLAEGLVNLGHDGDFLAAVVDNQLAFRLWQIPHEPQHGDPHG